MQRPAGLIVNDLTSAELGARLRELEVSPQLALRVFARSHLPGATPVVAELEVPGLSRRAREALAGAGARLGRLEVVSRHDSATDGFRKYLLRSEDGALVETVRIPLPAGPGVTPEHHVVCVSSQAGCALDCAFCATGKLGLARNLAAWEMVEQVTRVRDESDVPVRGVVFMGMGEPMLNYDAVLTAAEILAEPAGLAIARKAMTVSTAGVVPGIRRFADERRKHRLAISLGSAIPEKRAALMPRAARWSVAEVLDAARLYNEASGERVLIAYVMLAGINVGREDAEALVAALGSLKVRLNLIDVNDSSGRFQPPDEAELTRFRNWLTPLGQPVVRRYSGGKDIDAACGMLAARAPAASA
jgi:23S rRNA (adenine2503-C2)-methyltransferase